MCKDVTRDAVVRIGIKVKPAGQVPGVLRLSLNNRRYGAGKLRFPRAKEFIRKLFEILARALLNFTSSDLGPYSLKSMGFQGRHIIKVAEVRVWAGLGRRNVEGTLKREVVEMWVLWVMALCSLVNTYQLLRG
jgi:hypothetical protein